MWRAAEIKPAETEQHLRNLERRVETERGKRCLREQEWEMTDFAGHTCVIDWVGAVGAMSVSHGSHGFTAAY